MVTTNNPITTEMVKIIFEKSCNVTATFTTNRLYRSFLLGLHLSDYYKSPFDDTLFDCQYSQET